MHLLLQLQVSGTGVSDINIGDTLASSTSLQDLVSQMSLSPLLWSPDNGHVVYENGSRASQARNQKF